MKRFNTGFIIVICLFLTLASYTNSDTIHIPPDAYSGFLDLSNVNFSKNIYSLNGEWRFIWNLFLEPDDPRWHTSDVLMVNIPGLWKEIIVDEEYLQNTGYCSMQLEVKTPPGINNFGLKVNQVGTAYTLFVDDVELIKNGEAGTDRSTSRGCYQPRAVYFKTLTDQFTITMHIANFHDRLGGAWTRMYIGSNERISIRNYIDNGTDLFLLGIFFIIGIYYIITWYFGERKSAQLWFGLCLLMIAARTATSGGILLMTVFPDFSFELNHKIQMFSQAAFVYFFIVSLKYIFPKEIAMTTVRVVQILMILYGIVIIVTPLIIHSYLLYPFHIFVVCLAAYMIFTFILASVKKRPGGLILSIGLIILSLTAINDILYSSAVIKTGYVLTYGLILFSISYIIVLARSSSSISNIPGETIDDSMLIELRAKGISNRESEVLVLLLQGKRYEDMGKCLFISKSTVTKHVHSIYQKLDVKNRVDLYENIKRISILLEK